MRVRALDANGDMQFGGGSANFLVNSPAAVGQSIQTRLGLFTAEWFLDQTAGTPWMTQVLGNGTQTVRDSATRTRILQTAGVLSIDNYTSAIAGRQFSVSCDVQTIYGAITLSAVIDTKTFTLDSSILDGPDVLG